VPELHSPALHRHLRIWGGFLALIAGIILALPLVPGPGIPLILLGLVLLSDHFVWAKRILSWAKQKWQHLHPGSPWPHSCLYSAERQFRMNTLAAGQTYMIAERFDKVLKLVRTALLETDLSVVSEFDTTGTFGRGPGKKAERSRILLVECPLLAFEAQALDRSAGVFLPLHVLVWADGHRTQVSTADPTGLLDGRLPLSVVNPMGRLQARVTMALESVLLRTDANHHFQAGEE